MYGKTESEVKNDGVLAADPFKEEVNGKGKQGVRAEMNASDHVEENSNKGTRVEEETRLEPEENSGSKFQGVDYIKTCETLDLKKNVVMEQPHEECAVFRSNIINKNGPLKLHWETPVGQNTICTQEEGDAEEHKSTCAPAAVGATSPKETTLLQELREDREKALRQRGLLHAKLAEFFHKKAMDDGHMGMDQPLLEQEYEKHMSILTDLKLHVATEPPAEKLRLKFQEKLDMVEREWGELVALEQPVVVATLSPCLGKQAAQLKVRETVATEELLQDELTKLRLKHIQLKIKIHRLETELRKEDAPDREPLHLQFEQLQTERQELKKLNKKQNEESSKMQKKISSSLEFLSNVKEKLFWSQREVQAQREKLAELEATVSRKRDRLTRTKQARNSLLEDNLRLKERRGLLGNWVLLRDYEDTVDASNHLEEQLDTIKAANNISGTIH
ncbi:cilia- and flagella-associated protein 184 [Gasterosteus aculeatus]|uniref:coiled-coil domain-containing protein 96 n=1 Tax=Gasterosteus aculeatus aculeatus TaxID=481459 RepID=UPI001A994809|nr:coiled-coil domain-containing protein 96 [Gasterosteus aculeatus aculeatus]